MLRYGDCFSSSYFHIFVVRTIAGLQIILLFHNAFSFSLHRELAFSSIILALFMPTYINCWEALIIVKVCSLNETNFYLSYLVYLTSMIALLFIFHSFDLNFTFSIASFCFIFAKMRYHWLNCYFFIVIFLLNAAIIAQLPFLIRGHYLFIKTYLLCLTYLCLFVLFFYLIDLFHCLCCTLNQFYVWFVH